MARSRWVEQLARAVGRAAGSAVQEALTRRRPTARPTQRDKRDRRGDSPSATLPAQPADSVGAGTGEARRPAYPGDFEGAPSISYDPHPGALPDPGEVAWTWVPYEEDYTRGKDRPVLVIGRDGPWLLALPLTSKDHDRDAEMEARDGRYWHDIGTGSWDRQGRASEVRLDRIVRVDPSGVRREGAALSRAVFEDVVSRVLTHR